MTMEFLMHTLSSQCNRESPNTKALIGVFNNKSLNKASYFVNKTFPPYLFSTFRSAIIWVLKEGFLPARSNSKAVLFLQLPEKTAYSRLLSFIRLSNRRESSTGIRNGKKAEPNSNRSDRFRSEVKFKIGRIRYRNLRSAEIALLLLSCPWSLTWTLYCRFGPL